MRYKQLIAVIYWAVAIAVCAAVATVLWYYHRTPETPGGYFVIVCLYALAGVGAICDATWRKIPNRLNYPALILSGVLMLAIAPACELVPLQEALYWIGANSGEWGIAWESLKGFGLCAVVGIVSFAARGLGGGDVKLLGSVGLLAGWELTLGILCNTLLVALVMGVLNLLFRGLLMETLQEILVRIYGALINRNFSAPITFKRNENPFTLALFIGMILLHFVDCHELVKSFLPQ